MMNDNGKYEYFKGVNDLWYFNCIAGNGEVQYTSEGYSTKGNCVQAIGRCMNDTSHYRLIERARSEVDKLYTETNG